MACHKRYIRFILLALIVLPCFMPVLAGAQAQTSDNAQSESSSSTGSSRAFVLKGELGTFGELYSMSGIEARRPKSTGRLYLRSTLTAWNSMSANFNVMLSTEGNSARQQINQLDFNPKWRWGQAHLGDFSESLDAADDGGRAGTRGRGVVDAGCDESNVHYRFDATVGIQHGQ